MIENSWMSHLLVNYPFYMSIFLMLIGIAVIAYSDNLIKKVFGLNIFQTSIIIFYIAISKLDYGYMPVYNGPHVYNNPLPHVLMLTAIVVGASLTAVAFALIIQIKQNYNSISENYIYTKDL